MRRFPFLAFVATAAGVIGPSPAVAKDLQTPDLSVFEGTSTSNQGRIFGGGVGAPIEVRLSIESYGPWDESSDGFSYPGDEFRWKIKVTGPARVGDGQTTVTCNDPISLSGDNQGSLRGITFFGEGTAQLPRVGTVAIHCFLSLDAANPFGPAITPRNILPLNLAHWDDATFFIQVPPFGPAGNEVFVDLTAQRRPEGASGGTCDLGSVEAPLQSVEQSLASMSEAIGEFAPPDDTVAARFDDLASRLQALEAKIDAMMACIEPTVCQAGGGAR